MVPNGLYLNNLMLLVILVSPGFQSVETSLRRRPHEVQMKTLKYPRVLESQFRKSILTWPKQFRDLEEQHQKFWGIKTSTFRNIHGLCATVNRSRPKALESSPFIIDRPEFCDERPQVRYLIAVHSHTKSRHRRDLIRSTWGSLKRVGGERLATVFFLGRAQNAWEQQEINRESAQYR
ncbi:unnamed protein product [Echinostoma caproni]|uniref:Hexosyltransferase n=1 Tax=Echinostoma caproni TaxID=27848 RepID=A0A183AHW8_9TREM|nr:unnamed protein product [Echinostoma caproni]